MNQPRGPQNIIYLITAVNIFLESLKIQISSCSKGETCIVVVRYLKDIKFYKNNNF